MTNTNAPVPPSSLRTVKDIHRIIDTADFEAVCCCCALAGYQVQAWWSSTQGAAVLRLFTPNDRFYALISENLFDELTARAAWKRCGAVSSEDARIQRAALDWLDEVSESLSWKAYGSGPRLVSLKRCP